MHRSRSRVALSVLAAGGLAGALAVAPPVAAQTSPTTVASPPAKASILVDVDTGRVLYENNARTPLPPGSLTKTLTAMIATDWLSPDAQVPVTTTDATVYPDRVGMKAGQLWPLSITLHALITDSANDAAYALGEDIGGSLTGFAAVMQEAAHQIGMSDHPTLEDPAGLDGTEGFRSGNKISAWDLAVAGRDMMANPALAAIAAQRTFDFTGPDGIQYHLLSRNYHFLASYPGAVGVKTGFTDRAGYCDMEEAVAGGRRMLAVVLGSPNPDAVAADLITAGFKVPATAEGASPALPPVTEPEPPEPAPPPTSPPTTAPRLAARSVVSDGTQATLLHALAGGGIVIGLVLLTWTWRRRRAA